MLYGLLRFVYFLNQAQKETDSHGGRGSGNNPCLSWPETERISPLCPQEWQKNYSELDLVGWGILPPSQGGHGGYHHEQMKTAARITAEP